MRYFLISLSPDSASPVNNGEPLKIIAILEPPSSGFFILCTMCDKNNNAPSLFLGSFKNGYLINTSRGRIINQSDLAKAIDEKIILGYAADVISNETNGLENNILYKKMPRR